MIRKCLFPVAGYGTRFLPATKAMPKEMLPIVNKPLVQYGVEEATQAGINRIGFITGRGKRAIADHFDISYELEKEIEGSGKENLPALLWDIQGDELLPTFTKDSLKKSTVSMMAISQSVSVSESVVDAVANVLDGFTGTGVSSCRLVATETGEIEPFDGGDDYYYTHTLTLEVWHTT